VVGSSCDREVGGSALVEVGQQLAHALRRPPGGLRAFVHRLLGDDDLAVLRDGEPPVRRVCGVLAVGDDARIASVPAHRDDL
jgi:hypothetical protein